MKKVIVVLSITLLFLSSPCKKKKTFPEPAAVLKGWATAIQNLDYRLYCRYEAYPKSEAVFREMYRDYYIIDLMVIDAPDANEKDIRTDLDGIAYIQRPVTFEGNIVNRKTHEPYQLVRGDCMLKRFLDGKRARDGWLISNRTLMRIKR